MRFPEAWTCKPYTVAFGEIVLIAISGTVSGDRVVVEVDVTVGNCKLKLLQAVEI